MKRNFHPGVTHLGPKMVAMQVDQLLAGYEPQPQEDRHRRGTKAVCEPLVSLYARLLEGRRRRRVGQRGGGRCGAGPSAEGGLDTPSLIARPTPPSPPRGLVAGRSSTSAVDHCCSLTPLSGTRSSTSQETSVRAEQSLLKPCRAENPFRLPVWPIDSVTRVILQGPPSWWAQQSELNRRFTDETDRRVCPSCRRARISRRAHPAVESLEIREVLSTVLPHSQPGPVMVHHSPATIAIHYPPNPC